VCGTFNHEIWPVNPVQYSWRSGRSGGIVREGRGQLEADVAVGAPGALVHRAHGVGGVLDVTGGEPQEDLVGVVDPLAEQLMICLVVVGAFGDGFSKMVGLLVSPVTLSSATAGSASEPVTSSR